MAINPNRQQARLAKSEELLKKASESDIPKLALVVQSQKEALDRVNATYPQKLARHLRKCKRFGWTDARIAKKK